MGILPNKFPNISILETFLEYVWTLRFHGRTVSPPARHQHLECKDGTKMTGVWRAGLFSASLKPYGFIWRWGSLKWRGSGPKSATKNSDVCYIVAHCNISRQVLFPVSGIFTISANTDPKTPRDCWPWISRVPSFTLAKWHNTYLNTDDFPTFPCLINEQFRIVCWTKSFLLS